MRKYGIFSYQLKADQLQDLVLPQVILICATPTYSVFHQYCSQQYWDNINGPSCMKYKAQNKNTIVLFSFRSVEVLANFENIQAEFIENKVKNHIFQVPAEGRLALGINFKDNAIVCLVGNLNLGFLNVGKGLSSLVRHVLILLEKLPIYEKRKSFELPWKSRQTTTMQCCAALISRKIPLVRQNIYSFFDCDLWLSRSI